MNKEEKSNKFYMDLKNLLLEYDCEICLENLFNNKCGPNYQIVIDFNDFSPQIILGNYENGK